MEGETIKSIYYETNKWKTRLHDVNPPILYALFASLVGKEIKGFEGCKI